MSSSTLIDPEQSLLSRFGLTSFRPGQDQIIGSVLSGHDCLCVMPTGGGKSLCFQYPSLAREGTTLVVSPLIALMKDQVDSLVSLGIRAACINSAQSTDEQSQSLRELANGNLDLLYVAPERLRSPRFLEAIAKTEIQLLAIDEAHCISQWGHDFRPDYARLGSLRKRIGNPQTIALTATATPDVREDIASQLQLREPRTFVTGFARDNLNLQVSHPGSINEKNRQLLDFLEKHEGSGIVYASTRKKCEEVSELLSGQYRRIGYYHGGMLPEDREQTQNDFMDGKLDVIIATNAFGMGIDKPDIRFVVHYNFPGTLEAYYQEAGRAGRDGEPSDCLVLFSNGDRFIQEFFIENAYPSRGMVKKVYDFLRSQKQDPIEITLQDIKDELGLEIATDGIGVCEQLLEKAGALERLDTTQNLASIRLIGNVNSFVDLLPREAKTRRAVLQRIEALIGDNRDVRVYFHPRQLADEKLTLDSIQRAIRQLSELEFFDYVPPFRGKAIHLADPTREFSSWQIDFAEMDRRKQLEFSKLQTMVNFSHSSRCRQLEILEYFGQSDAGPCGCCDNCQRSRSGTHVSTSSIPPRLLAGVYHCVRIMLSGITRSRGRFGKTLVSQMLWGSQSAKMKKTGLQNLSTFGMLGFLSQSEIEEIIDKLIASQLVEQKEKTRFRPTIEISGAGREVMAGQCPLPDSFRLDGDLARKIAAQFPQAEAVISSASDSDSARSTSYEESEPSEPVVDVVQPQPTTENPATNFPDSDTPDWYWTLELLNRGFSVAHILEIRRLSVEQLFDHLELAIASEQTVDPDLLFTPEECVQLDQNDLADCKIAWLAPEYAQNAAKLYKKLRRIA